MLKWTKNTAGTQGNAYTGTLNYTEANFDVNTSVENTETYTWKGEEGEPDTVITTVSLAAKSQSKACHAMGCGKWPYNRSRRGFTVLGHHSNKGSNGSHIAKVY